MKRNILHIFWVLNISVVLIEIFLADQTDAFRGPQPKMVMTVIGGPFPIYPEIELSLKCEIIIEKRGERYSDSTNPIKKESNSKHDWSHKKFSLYEPDAITSVTAVIKEVPEHGAEEILCAAEIPWLEISRDQNGYSEHVLYRSSKPYGTIIIKTEFIGGSMIDKQSELAEPIHQENPLDVKELQPSIFGRPQPQMVITVIAGQFPIYPEIELSLKCEIIIEKRGERYSDSTNPITKMTNEVYDWSYKRFYLYELGAITWVTAVIKTVYENGDEFILCSSRVPWFELYLDPKAHSDHPLYARYSPYSRYGKIVINTEFIGEFITDDQENALHVVELLPPIEPASVIELTLRAEGLPLDSKPNYRCEVSPEYPGQEIVYIKYTDTRGGTNLRWPDKFYFRYIPDVVVKLTVWNSEICVGRLEVTLSQIADPFDTRDFSDNLKLNNVYLISRIHIRSEPILVDKAAALLYHKEIKE